MERYAQMRRSAALQVKRIEEGWRFEAGLGTGTSVDITAEIGEQESRIVRNIDHLIKAYEARIALGPKVA
jgi:hypothetical protein